MDAILNLWIDILGERDYEGHYKWYDYYGEMYSNGQSVAI
jgi:hypothetical protein